LVPAQEKARLVSALARAQPSPALLRLATGLLGDSSIQAEAVLAVEHIAKALVEQQPDAVMAALARSREQAPNNDVSAKLAEIEQVASALSRDIHERIDPRMPNGYRLACYLNAGAAIVAVASEGATIRQLRGKSYRYSREQDPTTVVAFDPEAVDFEIAGLARNQRYMLGVTWWDVDNNGRVQSIAVAPNEDEHWTGVYPKTRPIAFHANEATYAVLHLPLDRSFTDNGQLRVRIRREGPSNAVISEMWLLEQPHSETPPERIAIVTGDDYPGHRWRETAPELAAIFREDPRFEVTIIESPAIFGSPLVDYFDAVVVHFKNYHERMPTDQAHCDGLADYVRSGGGLIVAHFGCGAFQEWDEYVELAGRVWNPKLRGHDPYGPFTVRIVGGTHPITRGMADFETADELYTCLAGETPIHTLCTASSRVDQQDYPMAIALQVGEGRVFHCPLGHDVSAFQAEGTRALYRRGTAWVVGIAPNATDQ
jgi:type 1 glutamine amidotransferase